MPLLRVLVGLVALFHATASLAGSSRKSPFTEMADGIAGSGGILSVLIVGISVIVTLLFEYRSLRRQEKLFREFEAKYWVRKAVNREVHAKIKILFFAFDDESESWRRGTQKFHDTIKIDRLPAHRLGVIVAFLLPKKFYERTIEPVIADAHWEYIEALNVGKVKQAWWIKRRVIIHIVLILIMSPVTGVIAKVAEKFTTK